MKTPPHIIIPPVQYSQHFTSSSLSPVSASLFESINTIQYNPESGSAMPPLTSIQLNEEKQQIANIIKDSRLWVMMCQAPWAARPCGQ